MNEPSGTHFQPQTTYYQQLREQPIEKLEALASAEWQVRDVILDLYEITALLGEGGMGKVFRAHHRGWNLDLAVKCPKAELFAAAQGKEDYVREAETWINLGLHPHVTSCYYVRTLGGVPRLFAECVEGGSLESWIENRRLYEGGKEAALERILDIAIQFAWGLGYAHEQGLVHQDVKPHNVLMTPEAVAKVTDFGLAKARMTAGVAETPTGGPADRAGGLVSAGGYTPAYCSPEQAAGRSLDHKTDIWSWAVSILEMFTGGVTWLIPGQYAATLLEEYLATDTMETDTPAMPAQLVALLRRCFVEDPADRPQDMNQVANTLQQLYLQATGMSYARQQPKVVELRADSLNNKALSMLDMDNPKEAEAAWSAALKADMLHLESRYNFGLYQWKTLHMSDHDVITALHQVIRAQPDNWRCHYLLGMVHMERGDYPAARTCMADAARLAPQEVEVLEAEARLADHKEVAGPPTFEGHQGTVTSVAYIAGRNNAISGGADKTVRIWDLATGAQVRRLKGHHDRINALVLTPDGRFAVSASRDTTLRVWQTRNGDCVQTLKGHKGSVEALAISRDGKYVVSGSADKTLKLWELDKFRCLRTLAGHKEAITSIALTPDGTRVVSGCSRKDEIRVWNLSSGACQILSPAGEDIYALILTDDGSLVVSCGSDGTLRLWDLSSGQCIRTFLGHTHEASDAAITSDGKWMVSASFDKSLRLWELSTGECVRMFIGHDYGIGVVKLVSDDRALSASADKTLKLWDLKSGRCLRTYTGHTGDIETVALSADRHMALSGSADGTLREWKLSGVGEVTATWAVSRPRTSAQMSQAAQTVQREIAAARSALVQHQPGLAQEIIDRARSVPGFQNDPTLMELRHNAGLSGGRTMGLDAVFNIHELEGHKDQVYGLGMTHDCRFALSGGVDQTLRWWSLGSGECLRTFTGHQKAVVAAALTPDETRAVSGSEDRTLRIWDLNSGECLRVLEGHVAPVKTLAMAPDGLHVLSGDEAGALRLWRLATGECVRAITAHQSWVNSVAITSDGYFAVSGGHDKLAKLWRLIDGACLQTFTGHTEFVTAVALTPYVGYAVTASFDKTLRLWNLSTGECPSQFKGHEYWPACVALTPDGRVAFSGALDRTIRMWDIASGAHLSTISAAFFGVTAIILSQDGRTMIHAEEDGTLYVSHLEWQWEFVQRSDWNDGALPYLRTFLILHTPYGSDGLSRVGVPSWTKDDFSLFINELRYRGYGWLRPEGVQRKLEGMAAQQGGG
jgi:WD40 repeat protein/serine/threonine protein kinase